MICANLTGQKFTKPVMHLYSVMAVSSKAYFAQFSRGFLQEGSSVISFKSMLLDQLDDDSARLFGIEIFEVELQFICDEPASLRLSLNSMRQNDKADIACGFLLMFPD